jgi:transcriptional regulator with XRE-family HTH domain
MNLNSRKSLIARLRRGKTTRQQFVESHLSRTISHQLRATREKLGLSQERLAEKAGMNQNAISRLESSDYGKPTITTLKRLAASMDVGLIVRLVPFSEMIDWVSGTPREVEGLNTAALAVPCFDKEEENGVFDESRPNAPVQVSTTIFDLKVMFGKVVDTAPATLDVQRRASVTMSWHEAKYLRDMLTRQINAYETREGPLPEPILEAPR